MALHQLRSITIGVPDAEPVARFYEEFGLERTEPGVLSTTDGGRQLFLETAPTRRLVQLVVGVDDRDDLERVRTALEAAGHPVASAEERITTVEQKSGVRVVLEVTPRGSLPEVEAPDYNGPGAPKRVDARAPGILRHQRVHPRKLGHVVFTTSNFGATNDFFTTLIGFKVSDYIGEIGAFLRCSTDHHNLLVLEAPITYLHHSAWQVDDIDEIGRGASALLEGHPERHVWGLGRHHAGSNFFWYLRDPAGNFSEYYSDLDYIPEDAAWTPETAAGKFGLYNWGLEPPATFLAPDDLLELATRRSVTVTLLRRNPPQGGATVAQVVIVGGGPVGLSCALELAHHGVRSLVLERRQDVTLLRPRAKTVSPRTMEHLRRWGLADRLRERAPLPVAWSKEVVFCTTVLGREIARFSDCFGLELAGSDLAAESGQQVAQPYVERLFRDTVAASEYATLMTGVIVVGVIERDDSVEVEFEDAEGGHSRVTAPYVLGCVGAGSVTRDAIGASFMGSDDSRPNLNVTFRAPELADLVPHGAPAIHYWVLNPDQPGLVGPLDLEGTWWGGGLGVDPATMTRTPEEIVHNLLGEKIAIGVLSTDAWRGPPGCRRLAGADRGAGVLLRARRPGRAGHGEGEPGALHEPARRPGRDDAQRHLDAGARPRDP
jgi:catechol 2,3-dioxygenase-like lactoylglutathione lyase family enzyme